MLAVNEFLQPCAAMVLDECTQLDPMRDSQAQTFGLGWFWFIHSASVPHTVARSNENI